MPFDPAKGNRHMPALTIEIPEDILIPTGQTREGFIEEAKFLLAAKLFELGRLSSARAAELCGMDRVTFLLSLHRVGVAAIDLDEREIEDEVRYARGR
jgi:predicted HTH domain antitoxin